MMVSTIRQLVSPNLHDHSHRTMILIISPSDLITLGLDGTTVIGVNPRSSPNVGAYSDRSTALDGDAPPKITTQYVGSVTDTFDFDSFYFGCVLATGEAVGSLPKPCTVTVVGYKASIEVARQDFEFDPGTLTANVDMVKAELNDKFRGIDTATFDTEGGELGSVESVLVATLLDDLKYTVYDAKDKKEGEEYDGGDEMENEEDHGLVSSLSEVL